MGEPTNPKNSNFIEELQKASEKIEGGFSKKKPVFQTGAKEEVKEKLRSSEKTFAGDFTGQAEEVAKEKKRLEEIQKNLENHQRQVSEQIQELTTFQEEIARILERKRKIDEDLRKMKEKNKKIFEELGEYEPG